MKFDVCVTALKKPPQEFEDMIQREIPTNTILYSYLKPLGTARQELIDQVDTSWFFFIDTDIVLLPGFYKTISSYADERTGGIDGMWSHPLDSGLDLYQEQMKDLARLMGKKTATEKVARAFTGEAMIRTDLVKDVHIPPIPVFEDEFIKRHIVSKGYDWKRTKEVICLHMRKMNIGQAFNSGYWGHQLGYISVKRSLKNAVTIFPKTAYATLRTKQVSIISTQINREIRTTLGVCTSAFGNLLRGKNEL
jgi:hypothetical protein